MKNKIPLYIASLFVLLCSLLAARPAFAHGGDARIEISSEQLSPGATLDIRGVDFGFEEPIALALTGANMEIPLGSAIADAEGVFQLTITLPVQLNEGLYIIRATTDDRVIASPQIKVWGSAVGQDTGGDRLDEDAGYGLLAPMPTPVAGISTLQPQQTMPIKSKPSTTSSNTLVWIAAGIGIIVVLGLVFRTKR